MKRFLKKAVALAASAAIAATSLLTFTNAAIGDVIGTAVKTDIAAYIDNFPIQSYNIDGYTAVVAEDLADYGFDVVWDGTARALYITTAARPTYITDVKPVAKSPKTDIGKRAFDVLSTDIKTYINGEEVVGRNVGGQTIISFEDLAVYGKVNYDNDRRALFLDVEEVPNKRFTPVLTAKPLNDNDVIRGLGMSIGMDINCRTPEAEISAKGTVDAELDFSSYTAHLNAAVLSNHIEFGAFEAYFEIVEGAIVFYFDMPNAETGASEWIKMTVPMQEEFPEVPAAVTLKRSDLSVAEVLAGIPASSKTTICGRPVNLYETVEEGMAIVAGVYTDDGTVAFFEIDAAEIFDEVITSSYPDAGFAGCDTFKISITITSCITDEISVKIPDSVKANAVEVDLEKLAASNQ